MDFISLHRFAVRPVVSSANYSVQDYEFRISPKMPFILFWKHCRIIFPLSDWIRLCHWSSSNDSTSHAAHRTRLNTKALIQCSGLGLCAFDEISVNLFQSKNSVVIRSSVKERFQTPALLMPSLNSTWNKFVKCSKPTKLFMLQWCWGYSVLETAKNGNHVRPRASSTLIQMIISSLSLSVCALCKLQTAQCTRRNFLINLLFSEFLKLICDALMHWCSHVSCTWRCQQTGIVEKLVFRVLQSETN